VTKQKVTGRAAARKTSKVEGRASNGSQALTAAGSALSQTSSPTRQTSAAAASAAGRTLRDSRESRAEKSAAASPLSQRTVRSSARTGNVSRSAVKSAVKAVKRARSR
jgi:hypothetical protein